MGMIFAIICLVMHVLCAVMFDNSFKEYKYKPRFSPVQYYVGHAMTTVVVLVFNIYHLSNSEACNDPYDIFLMLDFILCVAGMV